MQTTDGFSFDALTFPPYQKTSAEFPPAQEILLAGCDEMALEIYQHYQRTRKTKVLCFINVSKQPVVESQFGVDVLSLEQAKHKYPDKAVVIVSMGEHAIADKLRELFSHVYLYRKNVSDITTNRDLLTDQLSKDIISQQDFMLRNNIYVDQFSSEGGTQYEHPVVKARPGEQIISIGPYYGLPLKAFADACNNDFKAHCLEANPYVYAQLCLNIVDWGIHDKIVPVCAGAWSESGMTAFSSDGHTGGGDVVELKPNQKVRKQQLDLAIYAYSIDDYVTQSGFAPTLLESGRIGIATAVIKGATETIKKYKPKLILLDFPYSDVPSMLKQLVPEYKIYYSECSRINYGAFFAEI